MAGSAALMGINVGRTVTFTFLIGCGIALNNPAWQASVGDMVPRHDIPAATMLNSAGFNLDHRAAPVDSRGCPDCGVRDLPVAVLVEAFEEGRAKVAL